jgi:uncharacterized phage infection (PIP) family protein YhgE
MNSQVSQLDADFARINNLTSTITLLRSQVSLLNSGIASDLAKINSLTSGYTQANSTVGTLQSQVTSQNSQIANLDAQVATLDSQIATYQSEITSLQDQVHQFVSTLTAINDALGYPVGQLVDSNMTFSVSAGSDEEIQVQSVSFDSVLIVGVASSTASNTYVFLNYATDPFGVDVGNSGVAAFVLPEYGDSYTLSIYSGNMTSFTATINVWYFHA